jgi:cytochrome c oxidase cbb3-type subunit III
MTTRLLTKGALPIAFVAASLAVQGCNAAPGIPKPGVEIPRPDAVLDFPTLYQQNCAGCHGAKGVDGPSYPLANQEYQALVDETTLRKVIAEGGPGTLMPAFASSAGGALTDQQVDALVAGMRAAWWKQGTQAAVGAPGYRASSAGNSARGQTIYASDCASCHGEHGKAGSVTNPAFLALLSDQGLRTIVVAGRPDIGQPDWRGELDGQSARHAPMTDQDVTDVVAWMSSQRPSRANNSQPAGGAESRNGGGLE